MEPGSCIRSVPSPSRGTFCFNASNYGGGSQICIFFPPPPRSFRRCWYLALAISLFAQEHCTGHISGATRATGLAACWHAVSRGSWACNVSRGSGVQSAGSTHVPSLCSNPTDALSSLVPPGASSPGPIPAPRCPVPTPGARWAAAAWGIFTIPLSTYLSSWIFQRKSGLGLRVVFLKLFLVLF